MDKKQGEGSDSRQVVKYSSGNVITPAIQMNNTAFTRYQIYSNELIGPHEEELDGLNIEERKRRRSGPVSMRTMDIEGELNVLGPSTKGPQSEGVLSDWDCTASSPNFLATLVEQDSQPQ